MFQKIDFKLFYEKIVFEAGIWDLKQLENTIIKTKSTMRVFFQIKNRSLGKN